MNDSWRRDAMELVAQKMRTISIVRADAERDAHAYVKPRNYKPEVHLLDLTKKFFATIKDPIPTTGRVIFRNVPIFAAQGFGKTDTSVSIALSLLEFYGYENVSVHLSSHLPSLVNAMRDSKTLVKILICDDALTNYISRGGTNEEGKEAIGMYYTMRHRFQEAQNTTNGIVFVMFTTQGYKITDKVFREGSICIFKTALTPDRQDIESDLKLGDKAWDYLRQLGSDIDYKKLQHRMADSVVYLPSFGAGRLHIPHRNDAFIDEILRRVGTTKCIEALSSPLVTDKYKALIAAWKIKSLARSREDVLRDLNTLQDVIAKQFAQESTADVSTASGSAALQEYLSNRTFNGEVPKEQQISAEDYQTLITPQSMKTLKGKVGEMRKQLAHSAMAAKGFQMSAEMSNEEVIRYAANWLRKERGLYGSAADDMKLVTGNLWQLEPPELRERAVQLRVHVRAILTTTDWENGLYDEKVSPQRQTSNHQAPAPAVSVKVDGDTFDVDGKKFLDDLILQARARDAKRYRELVVYSASEYHVQFGSRTMSTPTELAEEQEGIDWQKQMFGAAVTRPQLTKDREAGKRFYSNAIGLEFEKWVAKKLRDGYVIKGTFDRGIVKEVHNDGGNGHGPDITVVYENGYKDYVSLKCYNTGGVINLTTDPSGKDEIKPERTALIEDERVGVRTSRVVVLMRNLWEPGLQSVKKYVTSSDIPETIGQRRDAERAPFVKREAAQEEPKLVLAK